MLITLIILVLSAAFFVAGKVRSDIVALCALIGLLIFQILTPEEALSGFSNSVVNDIPVIEVFYLFDFADI